MSLEGRDLSDTQILDATQMENDSAKGSRLAIQLPSGRWLYSDYGPADELRKRLIPWCESVRSAIDSDILAEREEKKALSGRAEMAPPLPELGSTQPEILGAKEYAEKQLAHFAAEEMRLREQSDRIIKALGLAIKEVQRWGKVVEALKEDGE